MSESNNQLFGKKIGNYTLHEFLGGGQFGQVYRAVDQEGGIVAIKIIPLESLKQHDGLVKKLLIEEVDSMAKIDNPNVVKIMTYIETKKNCYLVMEYCDCGNLMDLLHKNNGQFSQVEALSIFKQISNGMMGLHEKHIMHRDLKLENIFLHQGNQVKIGDLGFSKRLKHQDDMDNVCLGTLGFMAPEVAKLEPYGLQADIFSMGAILYILLYKRLPFSSYNMPEFVRDVKRNQIDFHGNPSVTIDVINLLKAMLKEHPQDRITFYEMYKLPLFINKSQYINGITRTNIITNQINFQANKEFYEKSKFLDPEETKKQNMQQNSQLKKTILSDSGVQGEKMDLSNGIGIIDQSLDQKQQKQQKQQEEQQKQQQQQYQQYQQQQQTKYTKLSQNQKPDTQTYKTPEDFNNALQRYSTQQKNLLPQEEEEDQVENKQLENQPKKVNQKINLMSIQDERLINELIEKYFDRFNSIQYLLNTLYELSLIHLPSVYPIIYPQMMLHKKTIVEFKKFQKQLQANENIFQSTVHEKIKNKIDLNTLKDNINEQIVTQQNLFHIHYQAQVEHNYKKIEPYVQQKWLIDNQIEPSVDFNQNYQEAMEQIQTIVNQMKQQKIFPLLIKFERHLKCCLNFEQLLKEKVQLSMEFDLQ